jgi:bacillithiol system protein YtxJ
MTSYHEITSESEWATLLESSMDQPVLLLKHSTRCPVSSAALEEYEAYLADHPRDGIDYVLVKVIESRPVSNRIAADTGVKHESPQMILLKDKAKYWSTTHWSITKKHIHAVLDE